MDREQRREWIVVLEDTPKRLRQALRGLTRKQALWTPAPGKWSVLEIVCHMRDMERDAYLARYRRVLAEERPSLPDIDGDRLALEADYRSQKLGDAVREWRALRQECLSLLEKARPDDWSRAGVHETAGPLTMQDFLRRQAVGNDQAHLAQIEAMRPRAALLARLEAGPARLARAVTGLPDETLRRQPEPGKWSIVEIVCHLRDVERIFVERFSKMAFSERPQLWMTTNDLLAGRLRYREADLDAALREFKRLRTDALTILRALPHPIWQRIGLHPKRGEMSIQAMAEHLANHQEHHEERIRALR